MSDDEQGIPQVEGDEVPCSFCDHKSTVVDTRVVFATRDRAHAVCAECVKMFFGRMATLITLDMLDEGKMTKH